MKKLKNEELVVDLKSIRPVPPRFERPREFGTMFCYRKIDVLRVVEIAKAIAENPKVIDIGCGCGDFIEKIREYLPNVIGVDKNPIFAVKPFIKCIPVEEVDQKFDLAFLGWMELGADYREATAKLAPVIISIWERGGACGIGDEEGSSQQDFKSYGFLKIASWRTPAWFDIDMRLRSPFYDDKKIFWIDVGSIWNVWVKPQFKDKVIQVLEKLIKKEKTTQIEPYDFEEYLDKAGYNMWKEIQFLGVWLKLWEIQIHH